MGHLLDGHDRADALHFGHDDVGHNQGGLIDLDDFERLAPVFSGLGDVAGAGESARQDREENRVVVDDQNLAAASAEALRPAGYAPLHRPVRQLLNLWLTTLTTVIRSDAS